MLQNAHYNTDAKQVTAYTQNYLSLTQSILKFGFNNDFEYQIPLSILSFRVLQRWSKVLELVLMEGMRINQIIIISLCLHISMKYMQTPVYIMTVYNTILPIFESIIIVIVNTISYIAPLVARNTSRMLHKNAHCQHNI